jgi:hypothetical protein
LIEIERIFAMNTIQAMLEESLKREGKTAKGFYDNKEYNVLFRKVNDGNGTFNHLQIFYKIDSGIYKGQLLLHNNKTFMVLNQETLENEVYYKSNVIETNMILSIPIDGHWQYIPCYAGDLQTPTVNVGSMITTLNGNIELITESTSISDKIAYDTNINILGGTYEISNKYIKDGIAYIYVKRTVSSSDPDTYTITITNTETSIEIDKTIIFNAECKKNGAIESNPTLEWSSSDNTIMKINSDGAANALKEGTITITAKWIEGNITAAHQIIVESGVITPNYTLDLSDDMDGKIIVGYNGGTTVTALLKDSSGNIVSDNPSWLITHGNYNNSYVVITYPTANTCKVVAKDEFSLYEQNITIKASSSNGMYTKSISLPFGSW